MALSGPCMHQLQWWRATAPDPLVGVRACILEGPGGHVGDSDPQRGGVPGLYPFVLGAPPLRARDVAGSLPQWEVSPDGRCRQNSNGSSAEPVLSRVAGPKVLLQHLRWWNGDRSQRMGPRSHLLWEWRPDAACPLSRGGVAGF